ncbi:hypothetical protein FQN54_007147 [Arachnomyces sp. PD_36]|nr:hypothetical protein FQN54_007147 [Arachnomyces sp. PD_36]
MGSSEQIPPQQPSHDRDALAQRSIPWMKLGDAGSTTTAPPEPFAEDVSPVQRAALRFGVQGHAVFTGGAGTLALSAARALLEHGLSGLGLLDLPSTLENPDSKAAITALKKDFPQANILAEPCDVTDAKSLAGAVHEMRARLGPINILVCFAGIVSCVDAKDISPEQWRRVLDVNTTGAWLAAQEVGKSMIADSEAGTSRGGTIVFIASISGHNVNYPQPQIAYNVSKSALLHMCKNLAAEWTRYGIRVNSISPGYMDTILNEGEGLAPFRKEWASRNPMGRMGQPQELMGPLVFLCSRMASSYVNGTDIIVDGGGSVF